jgi:hypothetical protein
MTPSAEFAELLRNLGATVDDVATVESCRTSGWVTELTDGTRWWVASYREPPPPASACSTALVACSARNSAAIGLQGLSLAAFLVPGLDQR